MIVRKFNSTPNLRMQIADVMNFLGVQLDEILSLPKIRKTWRVRDLVRISEMWVQIFMSAPKKSKYVSYF